MDLIFITPVLFFFIALVFSMLGMGGSQLYIPILFWLGMDFKTQAIPLGLLLNIVNSSSALITYGRNKLVEWRIAIPFGLAMVLFAPLGAWLNMSLATKPVILIFSLFTAAAAVMMLIGWKPKSFEFTNRRKTIFGVSSGSILGFFSGLIGRGGGSFVVPLLYIFGLGVKNAAATSAFVITCSATSSFISHIFTAAKPQWSIWVSCTVAVIAGSQLGSRLMVKKLGSKYIKIIFGVILLGISIALIVQNFFIK